MVGFSESPSDLSGLERTNQIEACGNTILITLHGPMDARFIERIVPTARSLHDTKRQKVGLMIDAGASRTPPPEDSIRAQMAQTMKQLDHSVGALTVLIAQPGFLGVAWRMMHTLLFATTPTKYPKSVCSDAHEGARWLAGLVPGIDPSLLGMEVLRRAKQGLRS